MFRKIVNKVKQLLKLKEQEVLLSYPYIQNINLNLQSEKQKTLLLSYITSPFQIDIKKDQIHHTNQLETIQILHVFIELGYAVDICHCQEEFKLSQIYSKKYDLGFGFGKPLLDHPKIKEKILYCTESHPSLILSQIRGRETIELRNEYRISLNNRVGVYYKESDFLKVQKIVYKGNNTQKKWLPQKIPSFKQISVPFRNPEFNPKISDLNKNFIWFGSKGAVHKGLDLLIQIFEKNPNWNLFVCGLSLEERSLFSFASNVHDLGYVKINSHHFLDICKNISFVILPSIAEGVASGVLTCMNHGIIPIISEESGIDIDSMYIFEKLDVESIERKLNHFFNMKDEEILNHKKQILEFTQQNYNLDIFSRLLKNALI